MNHRDALKLTLETFSIGQKELSRESIKRQNALQLEGVDANDVKGAYESEISTFLNKEDKEITSRKLRSLELTLNTIQRAFYLALLMEDEWTDKPKTLHEQLEELCDSYTPAELMLEIGQIMASKN